MTVSYTHLLDKVFGDTVVQGDYRLTGGICFVRLAERRLQTGQPFVLNAAVAYRLMQRLCQASPRRESCATIRVLIGKHFP